jgi:hypothetical protein
VRRTDDATIELEQIEERHAVAARVEFLGVLKEDRLEDIGLEEEDEVTAKWAQRHSRGTAVTIASQC